MIKKIKADEKTWIAATSVMAAIVLTLIKIVVGVSTGSLGILSEAAHSALDLIAALITFLAVKLAYKPADKDHQFGHGKIENFSALIESVLLFVTCVWIISEAISRLFFQHVEIEVTIWSYLVVSVSIIIDASRSKALMRVAKKYNSQALEADALHFKTDIWSSAVVLLGLILSQFDYPAADAIASLFVAGIVIYISSKLSKKTIDSLLDKVPEGLHDKIKLKLLTFQDVEKINVLRMRQSGPKIFANISLHIRRTIPFEQVHNLLNKLEEEIKKLYNDIDVTIHPEPFESPNETTQDKVRMIATKYGLNLHKYEMSKLSESNYCIDIHVEAKADLTLNEVYKIISKIEKEILELNTKLKKVHIHIERIKEKEDNYIDVTEDSSKFIEELITFISENSAIKVCDNFSIFKDTENNKLKILFDCKLDGSLQLSEVHPCIANLEDKIKFKHQHIEQISIYAKPF